MNLKLNLKKQTPRKPTAKDFEKKPPIEDIMQIFQDFHQGVVYLMQTPQDRWGMGMVSRRASLRARLKNLGLEKHIDWHD